MQTPQLFNDVVKHKTIEKGHGRIETRHYQFTTDINWLFQKPDWAGLQSIGTVRSVVEKNGKVSEDTRYFISSLTDMKTFAKAVRSHWGIENGLHWCLDIDFNEDHCRTRKDNSAENLAVIRHLAVNIFMNYPAKMSLARKRRKCGYDADFMADVLLSAFA